MITKFILALKGYFKKPANFPKTAIPALESVSPSAETEPTSTLPMSRYPVIAIHDPQIAINSLELEVIFTKSTYSLMRNKDHVSAAFVDVYQCLSEGQLLRFSGSDTKWDDYDQPLSRTERYGTVAQGISLYASPQTSGHGAHGESGYWTYHGLPSHMKITAEHHVDYRMPTSRLKLHAQGLYASQAQWLLQHFALELREAIGGEWQFHEGTWSQPETIATNEK